MCGGRAEGDQQVGREEPDRRGRERISELTRQEQLPFPSMPSEQLPRPLQGDFAPPGHSGESDSGVRSLKAAHGFLH